MKIKPVTVVCEDAAAAAALVEATHYIGMGARRRGREVRLLTSEWVPPTHETVADEQRARK